MNPLFRAIIENATDTAGLQPMYDVPTVLLDKEETQFIGAVQSYVDKHHAVPNWHEVIVHKYPQLSAVWVETSPLSYQIEKFYEDRRMQKAGAAVQDMQTAISQNRPDLINEQQKLINRIYAANHELRARNYLDFDDDDIYTRRTFIPFDVEALDKDIGGLGPGEVAIAAARPGKGKTTYLLYQAWRTSHRVRPLVVSCETSYLTVKNRLTCLENGLNPRRLRGELTPQTKLEFEQCKQTAAKRNAYISVFIGNNDLSNVDGYVMDNLDDIDIVFIDSVYKLNLADATGDEFKRVAKLIRDLVDKAVNRWKKPVMITSQINRIGSSQDNPDTTGIAFSDAFAQEVDLALVIRENSEDYNVKEFHVVKDRHGELTGTHYNMRFDPRTLYYSMLKTDYQ